MNLSKLFDMQRKLDDHIMDEHPELKGQDNLDWKILALQVELGECANEWRGFKKWKKNREPRTVVEVFCDECQGTGTPIGIPEESGTDCWKCEGAGSYFKNPLLEEYVDGLHLVLSIGLELKLTDVDIGDRLPLRNKNIKLVFSDLMMCAGTLIYPESNQSYNYGTLLHGFMYLGELLGFTWSEIEQAYFDKNAINHERQANGY